MRRKAGKNEFVKYERRRKKAVPAVSMAGIQ